MCLCIEQRLNHHQPAAKRAEKRWFISHGQEEKLKEKQAQLEYSFPSAQMSFLSAPGSDKGRATSKKYEPAQHP